MKRNDIWTTQSTFCCKHIICCKGIKAPFGKVIQNDSSCYIIGPFINHLFSTNIYHLSSSLTCDSRHISPMRLATLPAMIFSTTSGFFFHASSADCSLLYESASWWVCEWACECVSGDVWTWARMNCWWYQWEFGNSETRRDNMIIRVERFQKMDFVPNCLDSTPLHQSCILHLLENSSFPLHHVSRHLAGAEVQRLRCHHMHAELPAHLALQQGSELCARRGVCSGRRCLELHNRSNLAQLRRNK